MTNRSIERGGRSPRMPRISGSLSCSGGRAARPPSRRRRDQRQQKFRAATEGGRAHDPLPHRHRAALGVVLGIVAGVVAGLGTWLPFAPTRAACARSPDRCADRISLIRSPRGRPSHGVPGTSSCGGRPSIRVAHAVEIVEAIHPCTAVPLLFGSTRCEIHKLPRRPASPIRPPRAGTWACGPR